MSKPIFVLARFLALALLALSTVATAQVASAEVQGIELTSPHSRGVQAWQQDGSVGEVRVLVRALDGAGAPVAGAPVMWRVDNAGTDLVYVVGSSSALPQVPLAVYTMRDLSLDGGVTDANGDAYLILDSMTSGDARVYITVAGVEAKGFDGRDMRVVWF